MKRTRSIVMLAISNWGNHMPPLAIPQKWWPMRQCPRWNWHPTCPILRVSFPVTWSDNTPGDTWASPGQTNMLPVPFPRIRIECTTNRWSIGDRLVWHRMTQRIRRIVEMVRTWRELGIRRFVRSLRLRLPDRHSVSKENFIMNFRLEKSFLLLL